MDERHLLAAARYVEMNPVASGIVARPDEYPWSSARAHIMAQDDKLTKVEPLLFLLERTLRPQKPGPKRKAG
jgi:putative transposase